MKPRGRKESKPGPKPAIDDTEALIDQRRFRELQVQWRGIFKG